MEISKEELLALTFEKNGGYSDWISYITSAKDDKTICGICNMVEEEETPWERYQLACGHKYHTRCFRKWMDYKKRTVCVYCGDMEKDKKNQYCQICEKFGHVDIDCKKTLKEMFMEWQQEDKKNKKNKEKKK